MKKIIIYITLFFSVNLMSQGSFRAKFISSDNAKKKWGLQTFDAAKFRTSTADQRAFMAVDALKKSLYRPVYVNG